MNTGQIANTLEFTTQLQGNGVLYHGMSVTGGGAVLAGLMFAAIGVFVIDRRFNWAAVFSFIAAALAFFGFIHGHELALNASPQITLAYAMVGVMFSLLAFQQIKSGEGISWEPSRDDEE